LGGGSDEDQEQPQSSAVTSRCHGRCSDVPFMTQN